MTDDSVRVRLDLAYDGTDFSGWAVQPDRRTVAGELLTALTTLFGTAVTGLIVAGRTDAGVHASGQVCHVDVAASAWLPLREQVLGRLARILPPDVRVTAVTEVTPEFNARFSALSRRYVYRVSDAPYGVDPLRRRDTLAWRWPLDLDRLNAASAGLLGEHDFAAYCRRNPNGTTIRALQRLDWHRDSSGVLVATVEADAFCHSMVRSLIGALLMAGDGRRAPEWPASLLQRRERVNEVVVVPAHGLTLVAVNYPEPSQWGHRAELTRRVRQLPG